MWDSGHDIIRSKLQGLMAPVWRWPVGQNWSISKAWPLVFYLLRSERCGLSCKRGCPASQSEDASEAARLRSTWLRLVLLTSVTDLRRSQIDATAWSAATLLLRGEWQVPVHGRYCCWRATAPCKTLLRISKETQPSSSNQKVDWQTCERACETSWWRVCWRGWIHGSLDLPCAGADATRSPWECSSPILVLFGLPCLDQYYLLPVWRSHCSTELMLDNPLRLHARFGEHCCHVAWSSYVLTSRHTVTSAKGRTCILELMFSRIALSNWLTCTLTYLKLVKQYVLCALQLLRQWEQVGIGPITKHYCLRLVVPSVHFRHRIFRSAKRSSNQHWQCLRWISNGTVAQRTLFWHSPLAGAPHADEQASGDLRYEQDVTVSAV